MTQLIKFASFNASFFRESFEVLRTQMCLCPLEQTELIKAYWQTSLDKARQKVAEDIIAIRSVAAIIQINRPDVLFLPEFSNEGTGNDLSALQGFLTHYLAVPQSSQLDKALADLEPIEYPYFNSFATNTGLNSGLRLDAHQADDKVFTNGAFAEKDATLTGDDWGFGAYHGQYAFALLSRFAIETENIRSFQRFKWQDLDGAKNPLVPVSNTLGNKQAPWYSENTWPQVRLSSKNHLDVPLIIPTVQGERLVHLLLSHPTPPVFDNGRNKARNAAEVDFWRRYIRDEGVFVDDNGVTGGLIQGHLNKAYLQGELPCGLGKQVIAESTKNPAFVIMGDLNLDPLAGDGARRVMQDLHKDPLLNQRLTHGAYYPSSEGGKAFAKQVSARHRAAKHPKPERLTSGFGLAVDHVLPSANLPLVASGVFWPAPWQKGAQLIDGVGRLKTRAASVLSDHRLVWVELAL